MSDRESIHEVMARLRAGDPEAAARVFHQFAQRLAALARTRLNSRLRQKVDPEDVLQSVYKSFFARHELGQFQVESWDSLWAILTVITLRKCSRCAEQFQTERRDVSREVAADILEADPFGPALLSREPTPQEACILTETVENLLRGLDGRERDMVQLSLQGYSVEEISTQVGRTRRTVQRLLKRVKEDLQRG
jgi:RNA polymerase sigma-70 factor (ECF subfamily)